MRERAFLAVSGTIFGAIALLHVVRLLAAWPVRIGAVAVPMWLSWGSALLAGYLAFTAFRLAGRR